MFNCPIIGQCIFNCLMVAQRIFNCLIGGQCMSSCPMIVQCMSNCLIIGQSMSCCPMIGQCIFNCIQLSTMTTIYFNSELLIFRLKVVLRCATVWSRLNYSSYDIGRNVPKIIKLRVYENYAKFDPLFSTALEKHGSAVVVCIIAWL